MGKKPSQPKKKNVPVKQEPEEYFMDKIWERRTEPDGSMRYLTSWIGFDESEMTWEPLENFIGPGALALVQKFNEKMDQAETVDHCVRANLNRARKSGPDTASAAPALVESRSCSPVTPHRNALTVGAKLMAAAIKRRKNSIGKVSKCVPAKPSSPAH